MKNPNLILLYLFVATLGGSLGLVQGAESGDVSGATIFTVEVDAAGEVIMRVASGNAEFAPTGATNGLQVGSKEGYSSKTGQVATLDPDDNFVGMGGMASDARSADGKSVAASSAAPSEGGGPGDVATAAGAESTAAGTETAAGGGSPPDTQAPVPPVNSRGNTGNATPV